MSLLSGLVIASTAFGEEPQKSSNSYAGFGVHGGLNFSDYNYSDPTYHQSNDNTGALFGIHMEGMALGIFGLRLEVNYSTKGYDVGPFVSVTHHYLQVPLLFKFSPIVGPIEVFAEAGPSASLNIGNSVQTLNNSVNYTDHSNSWDYSVIAGVGVAFKLDKVLLTFEGRYDYGLKNLNDSSSPSVNSRAAQFIAGITFTD